MKTNEQNGPKLPQCQKDSEGSFDVGHSGVYLFLPFTFSLKSCLSKFIFILSLILDELINTHVDPVLIRRTVRQSVRERSRSPLAQPAPNYRERLTERPRYVFPFFTVHIHIRTVSL